MILEAAGAIAAATTPLVCAAFSIAAKHSKPGLSDLQYLGVQIWSLEFDLDLRDDAPPAIGSQRYAYADQGLPSVAFGLRGSIRTAPTPIPRNRETHAAVDTMRDCDYARINAIRARRRSRIAQDIVSTAERAEISAWHGKWTERDERAYQRKLTNRQLLFFSNAETVHIDQATKPIYFEGKEI